VTRILRTSTRYAVPLLAFSALLFALAAPAAAAPASQQNCGPSLAFLGAESPQAVLFGATPMARKGDSIPDPGAQSPCSVHCGDGSYVTCSGSYCYAVAHNCSNNQEGYCYGSSTGTLDCPPTCTTCTAQCQDGSSVSCPGDNGSCSAYDASCSTGEQGHCTGDTGTKYCPALSCCNDSKLCVDKDGDSCTGTPHSSDCTFQSGGCGSCLCSDGRWNCTV